jgi:hypothetical protein
MYVANGSSLLDQPENCRKEKADVQIKGEDIL